MRKLQSLCAMMLGGVGVVFCILVISLSWWLALNAARRIDVAATRLDERLAQSDVKLTRIEQRVNTASAELAEVRRNAEALIVLNPEPARIRAELDRLENRLTPVLDRVRATADSLEALAEILLAAADIADQLSRDGQTAVGLRNAADAIDRAGATLKLPQDRIDAVATAGAVQVGQTFLTLAGKAIEGSKQLANGVATVRREAIAARQRTAECRDVFVVRVYAGALVITFLAVWGGLGQLCLIGHGRGGSSNRVPAAL